MTTASKTPFRTLLVDVQRQYTMSKRETRRMSKEEKERLVAVPLRIMGSPQRPGLYFVAKDVCILIHTRKGNVAKSIGQFSETQKARMPVQCQRSNGTVSTHILTVLTLDGVQRLLSSSRSALAPHVLQWITQQVDAICGGTSDADSGDAPVLPPPSPAAASDGPAIIGVKVSRDSNRRGFRDASVGVAHRLSMPTRPASSPASSSSPSVSTVSPTSSAAREPFALASSDSTARDREDQVDA